MSRIAWEAIYDPQYGGTPQETIRALYYEQGKGLRQVSKMLGVHRKALSSFMERNGMVRRMSQRKQAERKRELINRRKERC